MEMRMSHGEYSQEELDNARKRYGSLQNMLDVLGKDFDNSSYRNYDHHEMKRDLTKAFADALHSGEMLHDKYGAEVMEEVGTPVKARSPS